MTDARSSQPPLQHIVLMKFPAPLSVEEDARLRSMVACWPEEIGTMTELRFGGDLTGERTRGYQYLLVTTFPDAETLADYVAHPVHQQLIRFLDEQACERLAFDYYLDESTKLV
jgi:hypothetical protein